MEPKTQHLSFWASMERLAAETKIVIDRPKNSAHPRYPNACYPLDYGYLENTTSADGDGMDAWIGSHGTKTLTGILCVFDTLKREMEIKLLIACTWEDVRSILQFHHDMHVLHIPNPGVDPWASPQNF